MGFFEKLKNGLKKTKDSMMGRIESLLHSFSKIDEDLFEAILDTTTQLKQFELAPDRIVCGDSQAGGR